MGRARLLSAFLLLFPTTLWCFEQNILDKRVIEFTAEELYPANGLSIHSLSLMAWDGSRFIPVPFQIDEISDADMVWFPQSGLAQQGASAIFDKRDRLLALHADAGQQAPDGAQHDEGKIIAEIDLDDQNGQGRFFYLATNSNQRSERSYIHHDVERGITLTGGYTLRVDPDNELNWRFLGFKNYAGEGSIIDSLIMQMSAGFLYRRARMTLDNDNLKPRLAGYKTGPIRSVMHLETRIVLGGIPVMRLHLQAMRYPWHYEAHTYAKVPTLYRNTLRSPTVSVSINGNAQLGSTIRTARGGELVGVVDGKFDLEEKTLVARGLATDESWILFDSGRDFSLLAMLHVPPQLENIPLELIYEDDPGSSAPENRQAHLPNIGYRLLGWPPEQELRFFLSMLFDNGIKDIDPGRYAQLRLSRPAILVIPFQE